MGAMCIWQQLQRLRASIGTVTAGLLVSYLYSISSRQALPDFPMLANFLELYWHWLGAALFVFAMTSVLAEQVHRRLEARAPRPLRLGGRRSLSVRFASAGPRKWAVSRTRPTEAAPVAVGRETDLAQLGEWFAQASEGKRQVVFVAGEPGIGKTALVGAFLGAIGSEGTVRIGRGQCVEHYASGEPYMPILEALTRLCREPGGDGLLKILHRLAPAWLARMPSLVSAEDRVRLREQAQVVTQQRMLREIVEALEAMAADSPLVILVEDPHWSDYSTLELIAAIARRSTPARLLLLGTYRPAEMLAGDSPLRAMKQELELHRRCVELRLGLLSEKNVAAYLAQRFAGNRKISTLASAIHSRTEGNPLFMVNLADYLGENASALDVDKLETPTNICQMIERNLERLTLDEQRVLETASVAGTEFSAASVAAALERPVTEIEGCCTGLSRREQFIAVSGDSVWPDGSVASSFRFHHALYSKLLYARLPAAHRAGIHLRIAERQEKAYGASTREIASELAYHYGHCGNNDKALRYLELAAGRARISMTTKHWKRLPRAECFSQNN
jgi:predicted ATPase